MALSASQTKTIRDLLTKLQAELEESIKEVKTSSKPVELDQTAFGRVSRIDAIQQQQLQLASLKRMQQRLVMVNKALENIDSEDFGLCAKCEEPIDFGRLKARPESSACMACLNAASKA